MKLKILLTIVLIFVIAAGIHWSLRERSKSDTATLTLGQSFTTTIGQMWHVAGTNDTFRVVRLVSDSRCPSDVDCIVAGNVAFEVQVNGGDNTIVYDNNTAVMNGTYSVFLESVEPARGPMAQALKSDDYRLRFVVK